MDNRSLFLYNKYGEYMKKDHIKQESSLFRSVDFADGPVWKCVLIQSVPLIIAQLVQLLYNIVDRVYIGHMGDGQSLALTGVGLTFPVVTLIIGFAALFGMGGLPLFSIEYGAGRKDKAGQVLGNSFTLLCVSGVALTAVCYLFHRPILFAFGASEASFAYAGDYLRVYLIGTVFSMLTTGLNGYINAQGYPGIGMISVLIGALVNIALDPIFIFVFGMGVAGAATATVISQALSAAWVLAFLFSQRAIIPLKKNNMKLRARVVLDITKLGLTNFIVQMTACGVQVACNATLQVYGGDLYVGVMTVLNSIREIFTLPVMGIVNGAQPVISYNYGAGDYDRTRAGIRFNAYVGTVYTLIAWLLVLLLPGLFIGIFTDDPAIMQAGIPMLKIYFFGLVFMALQFSGQTAFQSLKDYKHSIFFSLLRKAVIVIPLTLLLPAFGFGVKGVFLAEPVSNIVGGTACFVTMMLTVYRRLKVKDEPPANTAEEGNECSES